MAIFTHGVGVNMILIHPSEVDKNLQVFLSDNRARHIRSVLKAEQGKVLRIGLLNGPLGRGTVQSVDDDGIALECAFEAVAPGKPPIDLLLAMPRPKVMKRLWAQLSALGVGRIVLVRAEKVERYYFDSHVLDPAFYTPMLEEGLQQACCTCRPDVFVEPLFKPFVEDKLDELFVDQVKLLADPSGRKRLADCVEPSTAQRIVLAVGPEGGWTAYELGLLREKGFDLFSMGSRILRTDTATVGLLSVLADYLSGR